MAGGFGEWSGGAGGGGAGRGEDKLGGVREEDTSHFVDGFVAKGGEDQPDFAAGKILFEEMGEFSRGSRIVRAIAINVGPGLQFFEAAGPGGGSGSLGGGVIAEFKTSLVEQVHGGACI